MPLPAGVVAEDARALLALARPHLPPDTPLPSDADVRCVDDVLQVILPTLADRLTEERARAAADLAAAQSERAQAVEARAHARALAVALRTARQAALAAETRAAEHVALDRRRALDRWTHQRMELELLLGRPLMQAELPVAEAPSTPPAHALDSAAATQQNRAARGPRGVMRPPNPVVIYDAPDEKPQGRHRRRHPHRSTAPRAVQAAVRSQFEDTSRSTSAGRALGSPPAKAPCSGT